MPINNKYKMYCSNTGKNCACVWEQVWIGNSFSARVVHQFCCLEARGLIVQTILIPYRTVVVFEICSMFDLRTNVFGI